MSQLVFLSHVLLHLTTNSKQYLKYMTKYYNLYTIFNRLFYATESFYQCIYISLSSSKYYTCTP